MASGGIDFQALAESVDELRETLRAIVAGLVQDGYTEAQARQIVVGMWASQPAEDGEGE